MTTNIKVISRCIYSWLNYLQSVSKSKLLLESSVRFPLAECIERQFGKEVSLECDYPKDGLFEGHKLDFCFLSNDVTNNIELKFLNDNTDAKNERIRYLSDLIRLASLSGEHTSNYFILAGSITDYEFHFHNEPATITNKKIPDGVSQRTPKRKVFAKWFPEVYGSVAEVSLSDFKAEYNESFKKIYRKDLPDWVISVELVAKESNENYPEVVFIWKVSKKVIDI